MRLVLLPPRVVSWPLRDPESLRSEQTLSSYSLSINASLFPWLFWLVMMGFWCLWLGRATVWQMLGSLSEHWFPVALLGVVYLMAAGRIGADLGIPRLFRDDPDPAVGFNWKSPALWGAFSATVLIGEIWIVIYLYGYIGHYSWLDPGPHPEGWHHPELWATPSRSLGEFRDFRSALKFLAASTPPFLGLLIVIAAEQVEIVRGQKLSLGQAFIDVCKYSLGILLGGVAVVVLILVGWWLAPWVGEGGLLGQGVASFFNPLVTKELAQTAGLEMATAVTAVFLSFLAIVLLTGLIVMTRKQIVASLAMNMLFGLIVALYFVLISLRPGVQILFVLALVAWTVWSNSGAYKFQLPGMGTANGKSLYAEANLVPAKRLPVDIPGPRKPLLDSFDVLNAWKDHLRDDRPKLVMVAVTGGAYRSAFWTAAVLDKLDLLSRTDLELSGLTDHIRLITGASGGMVGASYFVTLRGQPNASAVDLMIKETGRDSLSPVMQQLVQQDIPMIFRPITHQKVDRGVVLENQWKSIAIPFSYLYEDEERGQCPSLIVSPMVVETGERMLISNLDLRHLVEPHSAGSEPYLRSAREFFRIFPDAQPAFGLNTAVRLSATFPYVSPAVSLPTAPPRRLVDAGYYDNYGVNLAVAWAYQYRDWIRNNTSGLALIQIYAYPCIGASAYETGPEGANPGKARRGFQWLSSPIEGVLSARNWSMLYRNDEQLRLLDDTFNSPDNYDLRLMSWGDGSGVPTSGNNLVIVGTDDSGLLHIRIFGAGGKLSRVADEPNNNGRLHIRILDAGGKPVTDPDETNPPSTHARAISALKQQLPGWLPPHVLTRAEKDQVISEVTSILGQPLLMFDTFSFEYSGGAAMNWMITKRNIEEMQRSIAVRTGTDPVTMSKNNEELDRLVAWWNDRPTRIRHKRRISAPDPPQGIEFKPSPVFTEGLREKFQETLDEFRVYAHKLGFTPKKGLVKVKENPSEPDIWRYDPSSNTILVGKKVADDPDVMMYTYVHSILRGNDLSAWVQECLLGLGEGLADYFTCSFKSNPNYGKRSSEIGNEMEPEPYLRTMENNCRFDELPQLENGPDRFDEGKVWGGAFWELRQGLGKDAQGNYLADVLIMRTAMRLTPPGEGTKARADFVRQLLDQEDRVTGGRFASQIRDVFRGRRLEL